MHNFVYCCHLFVFNFILQGLDKLHRKWAIEDVIPVLQDADHTLYKQKHRDNTICLFVKLTGPGLGRKSLYFFFGCHIILHCLLKCCSLYIV